jgi:flavin-dependent thymidylate synthase
MKVILIDKNLQGVKTIISGLSLCRDKQCTATTIEHCITAEPFPHLSALEMCWFAFLVEGLSVKTRIQLERHRLFSTIERSTRSINMSDAKFVTPETAKGAHTFRQSYSSAISEYEEALHLGESFEDAAYLLPLGVTTKFQIAGNGRVWFEWLQKRLCKKYVQAEHGSFAIEVWRLLKKEMDFFEYAMPCGDCRQYLICENLAITGRLKPEDWDD